MLIEDVALIFEGGAMRNAYTAAVVECLLRNDIVFPKAYGISAGAALAAFYASGDARRAKATFTESVKLPRSGGLKSLLEGEGFFDLQYMFEGLSEMNAAEDDEWTFHFKRMKEGPTDVHIEAFDMDSGETVAWTRDDMRTSTDAMERVRASCSYPLFTPNATIDGRQYVDGGMGASHGICVDAALADRFERMFIVRTQPKPYRMPPLSKAKRDAYSMAYRKHPLVLDALEKRPAEYNALLDRIDRLEAEGIAYVFCPTTMPITYKTTDYDALIGAYNLGLEQCEQELGKWLDWIGRS